jgi:hypothetical protein
VSATKSELNVLYCAYYWADNPTDRTAKKALWDAVQKDRHDTERRVERHFAKKPKEAQR